MTQRKKQTKHVETLKYSGSASMTHKPTDSCTVTVRFWYPLWSPSAFFDVTFMSFMYKCALSFFPVGLTLTVCLSFCPAATSYWFLIFIFIFSCFFCLLSSVGWSGLVLHVCCLSMNVARHSAEPWASKSTKVTLTHSPAATRPQTPPTPPHHSQTANPDITSIPCSKCVGRVGVWVASSNNTVAEASPRLLDVCVLSLC